MLKNFEEASYYIPLKKPIFLDFHEIKNNYSTNSIEEETTADKKIEKSTKPKDSIKTHINNNNNNNFQKQNNNISSIINIIINNDDILQEHKLLNLNITNILLSEKENIQNPKKLIFSCKKRFHDENDKTIPGPYYGIVDNFIKNDEIKKNGSRKFKKVLYKKHDKMEKDNIVRKIQVHYCNFLVNFINEVIQRIIIDESYKTENAEEIINMKNYLFNNIDYKFKSNIKKEFMGESENMPIKDIISPQKKFCKLHSITNKNEQIMKRIEIKNNPILNKILNHKYLYYFNEIYYPSKRNIILNEENETLNINLSNNTKLFNDLVLKNMDDNNYIIKLKRVVMQNFSKPKFMFKIKK